MITLFEFRSSPYCEKVRLVLDIKGQDYQVVEINGLTRAELKGISTYPTVPVLKDGDRVVDDSTYVNLYLDEKYPVPPLQPTDPNERRLIALWEDWADESFGYDARAIGLWALRGNTQRFREDVARNLPGWADVVWPLLGPIAMQIALKECDMSAKKEPMRRKKLEWGFRLIADALVGRQWLVGERMTLADVAVVAHLWELRNAPQYEKDPQCEAAFALRDRVYEIATANRVSDA